MDPGEFPHPRPSAAKEVPMSQHISDVLFISVSTPHTPGNATKFTVNKRGN